jgi:23S rRNA (cytosine1962-C5)-methyltransferase
VRFERPAPPCFEAWARGALEPIDALDVALEAAIERRHDLLRGAREGGPEATSAFRLFSEAGDGVPGLALDVYGEHLVAHLHDVGAAEEALLDRVAARCLAPLGLRGLYLKRRPKKAHDLSAQDLEAHAPSVPVRGEAAPDEMVVRERGMPFLVRLGDGMSTGLFLDQRLNRARVRERAAGRRVLNLFAYTCGFTVAAALGGAVSTTSVDASRKALDRGRANLALSALDGPAHRFLVEDALALLPRLAKRGERFDLVCVDPPTFSTTRSSRWTSGRDWERLAALVFAVVAEGGAVLATSNDRRMTQGAFRAFVRRGAERAGVHLARLVDLGQPLDFRDGPGENPLLKGVLAELG